MEECFFRPWHNLLGGEAQVGEEERSVCIKLARLYLEEKKSPA